MIRISNKPAHWFHTLAHLCEPVWLQKFCRQHRLSPANDNWSPEAA